MRPLRALTLLLSVSLLLTGCGSLAQPEVPVTVTRRESLFGQGIVAQFHNQLDRPLLVELELENRALKQRSTGHVTIPASGTAEVG